MPSEHLLDFEKTDLSHVVATREDILKQIKQRGRFALLEGILDHGAESQVIVGFKDIRADDWWAQDHIPGRPIFPGALMVEAAAQLATYDYLVRNPPQEEIFLGFGGLDAVRFRSVIEPGVRMVFACKALRVRTRMFTYAAQGFVDRNLVFEAEIMGLIV
ncbi:MAG: beta-hydroxyacyl-ACP dehydratase [Planctomycetes bacterium]|nr:beta-hydroxyacyl-ACP dehydratase [Planctomycetota bacterium]